MLDFTTIFKFFFTPNWMLNCFNNQIPGNVKEILAILFEYNTVYTPNHMPVHKGDILS